MAIDPSLLTGTSNPDPTQMAQAQMYAGLLKGGIGQTPQKIGDNTTDTGDFVRGLQAGFGTEDPSDPIGNAAADPFGKQGGVMSALPASVSGGPYNPDTYSKVVGEIESSGNPFAKTGSNRGLYQFGPAEERQYGINDSNWTDPRIQQQALDRETTFNRGTLSRVLGRDPTGGELYLAHQQGIGGAVAHLTNPDRAAWQSMLSTGEGAQKGAGWARQAISENMLPQWKSRYRSVDDVSSRDFSNMWMSDFNRRLQRYQPQGQNGQVMSDAGPIGGPGSQLAMNLTDIPGQYWNAMGSLADKEIAGGKWLAGQTRETINPSQQGLDAVARDTGAVRGALTGAVNPLNLQGRREQANAARANTIQNVMAPQQAAKDSLIGNAPGRQNPLTMGLPSIPAGANEHYRAGGDAARSALTDALVAGAGGGGLPPQKILRDQPFGTPPEPTGFPPVQPMTNQPAANTENAYPPSAQQYGGPTDLAAPPMPNVPGQVSRTQPQAKDTQGNPIVNAITGKPVLQPSIPTTDSQGQPIRNILKEAFDRATTVPGWLKQDAGAFAAGAKQESEEIGKGAGRAVTPSQGMTASLRDWWGRVKDDVNAGKWSQASIHGTPPATPGPLPPEDKESAQNHAIESGQPTEQIVPGTGPLATNQPPPPAPSRGQGSSPAPEAEAQVLMGGGGTPQGTPPQGSPQGASLGTGMGTPGGGQKPTGEPLNVPGTPQKPGVPLPAVKSAAGGLETVPPGTVLREGVPYTGPTVEHPAQAGAPVGTAPTAVRAAGTQGGGVRPQPTGGNADMQQRIQQAAYDEQAAAPNPGSAMMPQQVPPYDYGRYYPTDPQRVAALASLMTNPSVPADTREFMRNLYADRKVTDLNGNVWHYSMGKEPYLEEQGYGKQVDMELAGVGKIPMVVHYDPKTGQQTLRVPGMGAIGGGGMAGPGGPGEAGGALGGSNLGGLAPLVDLSNEIQSRREQTRKLGDYLSTQQQDISTKGNQAYGQQLPLINHLLDLLNSGRVYTGTFADPVLGLKRAFSATGLTGSDVARPTEEFKKGTSLMTIGALRAQFGGLGQIRNTEVKLAADANASSDNTRDGNMAILQYYQRVAQQSAKLNDFMLNYMKERNTPTLGPDWQQEVAKFWRDPKNQLFAPGEAEELDRRILAAGTVSDSASKLEQDKIQGALKSDNPYGQFTYTRDQQGGGGPPRVQTQSDYDAIPSGGRFIDSQGNVRQKR